MLRSARLSSRTPVWVIAAALFFGGAGCARRTVQAPRPSTALSASEGLRAYRDPSTGAFVEPPPGAVPPAAAPAAAPQAMTDEAAPGGGRMIRLRGAFRNHLVGHTGADGATFSCASTAGAPIVPGPASP